MNVRRAKLLRTNSTDAEILLWRRLRAWQLDGQYFRRQAPMDSYVVDFVCHEEKLIIEIDGGHHAIDLTYDEKRTNWLNGRGYRVIRFWNNEVLENIDGVLMEIQKNLENSF